MNNPKGIEGRMPSVIIDGDEKEKSSMSVGIEFAKKFGKIYDADLLKEFPLLKDAEARKYAAHDIAIAAARVEPPDVGFVDQFVQFLIRENDQNLLDSMLESILFAFSRDESHNANLKIMEDYLKMIENPEIKDRAKKFVEVFRKSLES